MISYRLWHDLLDMDRKDLTWHEKDIAEEFAELEKAIGLLHRWSELSDVVYTVTRGRWGGHVIESPLRRREFLIGSAVLFF